MSGLQSRTHEFDSRSAHGCIATLGMLFTNLCLSPHTHHTHPFNGPFPGLPRWAGTRKVKPIWILLKQETESSKGISWAICKSAPRCRQITTPEPHNSVFTGWMPFLPPNQQRQSTEGTKQYIYCYWQNLRQKNRCNAHLTLLLPILNKIYWISSFLCHTYLPVYTLLDNAAMKKLASMEWNENNHKFSFLTCQLLSTC